MNSNTNSVMEKIKEIVAKGNVSRVLVRKDDKVLLNIPVTVGIVGDVKSAIEDFKKSDGIEVNIVVEKDAEEAPAEEAPAKETPEEPKAE